MFRPLPPFSPLPLVCRFACGPVPLLPMFAFQSPIPPESVWSHRLFAPYMCPCSLPRLKFLSPRSLSCPRIDPFFFGFSRDGFFLSNYLYFCVWPIIFSEAAVSQYRFSSCQVVFFNQKFCSEAQVGTGGFLSHPSFSTRWTFIS